jgi:PAS domain S-box-containing protein
MPDEPFQVNRTPGPILRILHLEDNAADADLIRSILNSEGIVAEVTQAQTRSEFELALEQPVDLILSDCSLPSFDGRSALEIARRKCPQVPFIFVSGTIGEEAAVDLLKEGAVDYVLKDHLSRLPASVQRAMRESKHRAEQARTEEALRQRNELFRNITENVGDLVVVLDLEGRRVFNSPSYESLLGDPQSLIGTDSFAEIHPDDRERVKGIFQETLRTGVGQRLEYRFLLPDGTIRHIESQGSVIRDRDGRIVDVVVVSRNVTERKAAEQTLVAAEAKFRTLVEQSIVGIYIIQDGLLTYVSPKMAEILGYSETELKGRALLELVLQEDRALVEQQIKARLRGITLDAHYILRLWRKDGRMIHAEVHGALTQYEGRPAIIETFLDITERKAAEERIREQATLLDEASDAICVTDTEQRILYWNQSAVRLYGWTATQAIGQNANELLFAGDISAPLAALKSLIANGQWHGELHQVLKDGERIVVESRWTLLRDEQTRPKSILVINTDITERKRAELKIREQAKLLDEARDAIFVHDLEQRVTYWNKGAERLYGWTAGEILGKRASEILYKQDAPGRDEIWKTVLDNEECTGELQQITKFSQEIVVVSRRTLVLDTKGQPTAILNINTDVTEKKLMEEKFLRAQRLESIGALAGGIAHDLNNMLAPILMAAELLEGEVSSEMGRKMLETVRASANRGTDMVKQILSFARGVTGEPVVLQLRHLIRDIAKLARATFPRSIRVQTRVSSDLQPILGDPTQLHQVLLNLCVNARDAMPNGGTLSLDADNVALENKSVRGMEHPLSGPFVLLKVSDTGTGIPVGLLERIFETFFTTKDADKGTGLGLSTVTNIVKNHEGFLEVSSEVDKGTSFRIYLPATGQAAQLTTEAHPVELPEGRGEQILVVDDERALLEMTRETLESYGYRVLTAGHGAEALLLYQQHGSQIAAVITDVMMPVMDGPALVRALRHLKLDVKIICISGLASEYRLAEIDSTHVSSFITKPFTSATLLTTVRQVITSN